MSKREDYISWNEYFMGLALLSGKRSEDPTTQVGACIIDEDKKICGYNMLVTSELKATKEEIYRVYHNLWRIEESFRMMKSELDGQQ